MTGLHQDTDAAAKPAKARPAKTTWLPLLEQELKRRVGWTDEAVSPFGRFNLQKKAEAKILRAA